MTLKCSLNKLHSSNPRGSTANLGPMAHLVQISAIWGDVLAFIYRSSHQLPQNYSTEYEAFYSTIYEELAALLGALPSYLHFTPPNLASSIQHGYNGTLASIHALYHITIMKLNRHVLHAHLSPKCQKRNICQAVDHAQQHLYNMSLLSQAYWKKSSTLKTGAAAPVASASPLSHHDDSFSTPIVGYAILSAVEILSAGGSLQNTVFTDTMRILNTSLDVIDELALFWASARGQKKAIRRRIEELAYTVIERKKRTGSTRDENGRRHNEATNWRAWVMGYPMEKMYWKSQDLFYVPRESEVAGNADIVNAGTDQHEQRGSANARASMLLDALHIHAEKDRVLYIEEAGDFVVTEDAGYFQINDQTLSLLDG